MGFGHSGPGRCSYVDIDSVLLQDPFPFFHGDADVWVANDFVAPAAGHGCTGLLAVRSTPRATKLITAWAVAMAEKLQRNQLVFNAVLEAQRQADPSLDVRFLPQARFRRGKEFKLPADVLAKSVVAHEVVWVHANFLIGLVPKIVRLRSLGLWPAAI